MPPEVPDRDEWFPQSESLPQPDWPAINAWMAVSVTAEHRDAVAEQIAGYWMARLVTALGDTHTIVASEHFLFVSAADEKRRALILDFLEKSRAHLWRAFGGAVREIRTRQQIFLRLRSYDDCVAALASLTSEDENGPDLTTFFAPGEAPNAYVERFRPNDEAAILAGSVASHLLSYRPLPVWVRAGATALFTTELAGGNFGVLAPETIVLHRDWWNAETIQEFWSGRKMSKLSDHLAEVLFDVIRRELQPTPEAIHQFIWEAAREDGGDLAARRYLGAGLGEIVSVFLDNGDWSPKPASWRTESHDSSAEPTVTLPGL